MRKQCEAVTQRRGLVAAIYTAIGLETEAAEAGGTEHDLLVAYDHLTGVVAEYTNGGDEMAEQCTCDRPVHKHGHEGMTFADVVRVYREGRE